MSNTKTALLIAAIVVHILAAVALVILFFKTGGMTVFCVVAGTLIGGLSVAARPGRPITLYIAFGVLMGYVFWMGASAISQSAFLELLILVLLAAGAVWFLQDPRWPAALCTAVLALLLIGLAAVQFRQALQFIEYDPELIRRSALTSLVVLAIGLMYVGLGFAEASLQGPPKAKRARRRMKQRVVEEEDE
jgi:hypothetical protein